MCDIFSNVDVTFLDLAQVAYFATAKELSGVPKFLEGAAPDLFRQKPKHTYKKKLKHLIEKMVDADPTKRPTMPMVIHELMMVQQAYQKHQKKKENKSHRRRWRCF